MDIQINSPRLQNNIRTLKYIGPLFASRLRKEDIKTLKDLKDLLESQSKSQNIRFLRRILENPRKLQCVGESRYDEKSKQFKKYCVRRVNQLAWYSIVTYMLNKGVSNRKLPDPIIERGTREKCVKDDKCNARSPIELLPKRYDRIPYYPLEFIVLIMLNVKNTEFTSEFVWRLMKRKFELRKISAIISSNADGRGRDLFQSTTLNEETGRMQYKLKSSIKSKLYKKSNQYVLKYLREL